MAGINKLQMDAATMTPAANPVSALCTPLDNSFFNRYTQAAPAEVPTKGINNPKIISVLIFILAVSDRDFFTFTHAKNIFDMIEIRALNDDGMIDYIAFINKEMIHFRFAFLLTYSKFLTMLFTRVYEQ